MLRSIIRPVTQLRVVGRPASSTQTRPLYFCGPKSGDHDPNLPITEHYHAHSRRTDSDAVVIADSLLATPTDKTEAVGEATRQLEAATHDDATTYHTAITILREIARLEVMLKKGEAEGKNWQELQRVTMEIEELKSLSEKMGRRM